MSAHASVLADVVLLIHLLFILFVVAGQALVMVGAARRWEWIRNLWFRLAHLAAIAVVVAQAWAGRHCPLTVWEDALRRAAGEEGYDTTFIGHWVGRLIYHDAPLWLFAVVYSVFGLLVAAYWFAARPRRP